MLLDLPVSTSKNSAGTFQKGTSRRHRGNLSRPRHDFDGIQIAAAEVRIVKALHHHAKKGIVVGQSPKEAVRNLTSLVNNDDHACGNKKQFFSVLRAAFSNLIGDGKIVQHETYFQLVQS